MSAVLGRSRVILRLFHILGPIYQGIYQAKLTERMSTSVSTGQPRDRALVVTDNVTLAS